jgi:predicted DNA-binding ribbon-helix-helix protein
MKSSIVKRSIVVDGHKTSVSLEDAFWNELKGIAQAHRMTLSELISMIDTTRERGNLSSAIRQYILHHVRNLFLFHKVSDEDERADIAKTHLSTGSAETKSAVAVSSTSQSRNERQDR